MESGVCGKGCQPGPRLTEIKGSPGKCTEDGAGPWRPGTRR